MNIIDTDQYIEYKENKSIAEIFSNYGEEYFRKCETDALIDLSNQNNIIISTDNQSIGDSPPIDNDTIKDIELLPEKTDCNNN